MQALTGTKFKIVEKIGIQLTRTLVNKNPWKGRDCYREDCFLCETKRTLGVGKQDTCWKQRALYHTWCQTCTDREKAKATEEGRNPENIKEHIYVGETSRSAYTRGREHKNDARLMNPGSHVLKHYLKYHDGEDPDEMKMGMKIHSFRKSAFERQVAEAVTIQQVQKNHHLMNSKSEYRACKIPRITIKMGDT